MDRPEEDIEMLILDFFCWRALRVGMDPSVKFTVRMSNLCLFDQRNFFRKVVQIFRIDQRLTLPCLKVESEINCLLRNFLRSTAFCNPDAENELQYPMDQRGLLIEPATTE